MSLPLSTSVSLGTIMVQQQYNTPATTECNVWQVDRSNVQAKQNSNKNQTGNSTPTPFIGVVLQRKKTKSTTKRLPLDAFQRVTRRGKHTDRKTVHKLMSSLRCVIIQQKNVVYTSRLLEKRMINAFLTDLVVFRSFVFFFFPNLG